MNHGGLRDALQDDGSDTMDSDEACLATAVEAERFARYLALNLDGRGEASKALSTQSESIWDRIGLLWRALALSFDPGNVASSLGASEDSRISLVLALGKLERNIVAGLQAHQEAAAHHEVDIRNLIFNITTFTRTEDQRFHTLHGVLTQLLSNIVSPVSAEPDAARIAEDRLAIYLSGRREDDVIIRLLDSRDSKTNNATLHLINNVTRNSPSRIGLLLSPAGLGWLSKILDRMDDWLESHHGRFELACKIINSLIDERLHSSLFAALSTPDEPISPSQTVLLKILDSHVSSTTRPNPIPSPNEFLIPLFLSLAHYAKSSMRSGQDDARLPKVFEGLVLVCEGLSGIGLAVQGRLDRREAEEGGDELMLNIMKRDVVKPLIDLLQELNLFLPRVKPGNVPLHSASAEIAPLSGIKSNLVRLLGILTYEDIAVGDLVRECGGVQLVLSMTEVDESNPYLREHALFVTRNLMLHNPANQALVAQMDPVGLVSETGELLPLPERMRRDQQRHEHANGS